MSEEQRQRENRGQAEAEKRVLATERDPCGKCHKGEANPEQIIQEAPEKDPAIEEQEGEERPGLYRFAAGCSS